MNIRDCHNPKCGVAFPVKHASSTQKFCSRSCAASANAQKRKPKPKKTKKRLVQENGLLVLPSKDNQPMLTLTCAYCKDSFQKRRKERFCSSMCRSFAEHARPMSNTVNLDEVVEDQAPSLPDIFEDPPSKAS